MGGIIKNKEKGKQQAREMEADYYLSMGLRLWELERDKQELPVPNKRLRSRRLIHGQGCGKVYL
jgi:hypothetical protein